MHFALVLLLQAAVMSAEPTIPSKDEVLAAYDESVSLVDDVIKHIPTRMGITPDFPYLGFTMRTEELGVGTDGLPIRHTFIVAVFRESPAFVDGIRPGDRIAFIGDTPVDTLKPKGVLYYLTGYREAVPLTLERNGKTYKVLTRRKPLACAAAQWKAFPVARWQERMTRLRGLIVAARTELAAAQLTQQQATRAVHDIQETAFIIRMSLEAMGSQLDPALSPRCVLVR